MLNIRLKLLSLVTFLSLSFNANMHAMDVGDVVGCCIGLAIGTGSMAMIAYCCDREEKVQKLHKLTVEMDEVAPAISFVQDRYQQLEEEHREVTEESLRQNRQAASFRTQITDFRTDVERMRTELVRRRQESPERRAEITRKDAEIVKLKKDFERSQAALFAACEIAKIDKPKND